MIVMQHDDSNGSGANQDLVERALGGDFRAIARLVTLAENRSPEATPYLRELFPHAGRCFTIGLTGSPGAGKSTLVDKLAEHYRVQGKKVGIIAVDPSSPFSGGAILGDRIRMQSRSLDPGVFIRSMATRGHIGGLTRATTDVMTILDAAGFDVILIETVGVGQGEVEIAKTADATIVLLVPGMGDDIQMMKAGIMEIADVFVINKSDRPGVEKIDAELKNMLSFSAREDGWTPPIVKTIASEGKGVEDCVQALEEYHAFLMQSPTRRERIISAQKEHLLELTCLQIRDDLLTNDDSAIRLQELASLVADRKMDPFTAADEIRSTLNKKSNNGSGS